MRAVRFSLQFPARGTSITSSPSSPWHSREDSVVNASHVTWEDACAVPTSCDCGDRQCSEEQNCAGKGNLKTVFSRGYDIHNRTHGYNSFVHSSRSLGQPRCPSGATG